MFTWYFLFQQLTETENNKEAAIREFIKMIRERQITCERLGLMCDLTGREAQLKWCIEVGDNSILSNIISYLPFLLKRRVFRPHVQLGFQSKESKRTTAWRVATTSCLPIFSRATYLKTWVCYPFTVGHFPIGQTNTIAL